MPVRTNTIATQQNEAFFQDISTNKKRSRLFKTAYSSSSSLKPDIQIPEKSKKQTFLVSVYRMFQFLNGKDRLHIKEYNLSDCLSKPGAFNNWTHFNRLNVGLVRYSNACCISFSQNESNFVKMLNLIFFFSFHVVCVCILSSCNNVQSLAQNKTVKVNPIYFLLLDSEYRKSEFI